MIRAALPIALAILIVPAATPAPSRAADSTPRDSVQTLVPGVDLVPGRFVAGHQPDGNSVIFHGPDGLVVVDTGRHPEHTQEIVDLARRSHAAVKVIVNSHWHLDHVGGNAMLRREFPGLRVYASAAIADAQRGFLADYRVQLETLMARSHDPKQLQAWRAEVALIDSGPALAPDVVVESSGKRELAGRWLDLELERYAATAGDVWVLDPATKVLAAGDLVTLPVPFLDTACPTGWKTALDHLAKADFRWLVPGHGPPLGRSQFETYRAAFGALVACAETAKPKQECVDGWLRDAAELIPAGDRELARSTLDYYMENSLRVDRARSAKLCGGSAPRSH
jgi:glyoxylase-like metal-dependent hydrolase (beta-lactamase superfamily II)